MPRYWTHLVRAQLLGLGLQARYQAPSSSTLASSHSSAQHKKTLHKRAKKLLFLIQRGAVLLFFKKHETFFYPFCCQTLIGWFRSIGLIFQISLELRAPDAGCQLVNLNFWGLLPTAHLFEPFVVVVAVFVAVVAVVVAGVVAATGVLAVGVVGQPPDWQQLLLLPHLIIADAVAYSPKTLLIQACLTLKGV